MPSGRRGASAEASELSKELGAAGFCILKNSVAYVFKSNPVGVNISSVGAFEMGNVFKETCPIAIH